MIRAIDPAPRERKLPPRRGRRRATFVKTDLTRAMEAAQRGGFQVRSIEISQDGSIRLYSDDSGGVPRTLFDQWEARL